jgi:hypothetical protein
MENAQVVYSGLTYDRRQGLDSFANNRNRGMMA